MKILPLAAVFALASLAACQQNPHPHTTTSPGAMTTIPATNVASPATHNVPVGAPASDLPAKDFQDALCQLDKSHHDKMKLAWYANSFLRSINPVFKPYYDDMARDQKALAAEIESWAKSHKIDLTFHYGPDVFGQGQKIMEDRQSKVAQGDEKLDFERDMLINMHMDYEWQISLMTALIPTVHDTQLSEYLQRNLHNAEAGSMKTTALLKRYKFE